MATQKELEKLADGASSVVKDKDNKILSVIVYVDGMRKEVKADGVSSKKSNTGG